jgi:NADH:ubiquinone oxidoreductase subunit C
MTTDGATGGSQDGAEETPPESFDDTIWSLVDGALAGITADPERGVQDLIVRIPKGELVRGLRALNGSEALAFDYLRDLTAIDWEDAGIDVVYHLYSSAHRHNLTVKCHLDNDDLTLDTATTVWRAANWLERETAEMFGVRFSGHPDPRPLLLPDDMDDTFPLRKEHPLAEIEVLQGEGIAYAEEAFE